MATQFSNKPIVTDGLVYALDFGNPKSYVSGSTIANSLKYETNLTFVTGSTSIPNSVSPVLFFTGSQWIERTGSFSVFNPNGAFTLSIVVNARTAGTLVSQTSSLGNLVSNVSPTSSTFGFANPNYTRGIQGLSPTQLNHLTYRYSSGTLDIFYNGTLITASQATISLPTSSVVDEFYINGNNGLLNNFSGSLAAISVYNRSLTINEIQSNYILSKNRYGLTQEQNYTLDENAFVFLQSAGITDPIITGSIDTFVRGLKANNLWDKMIAIYPFVGTGSAGTNLTGSHRWNLKEPSLVTYPLSFTGSWIGSTSGSAPSGSNTNISTQVAPSTYYPFYNTQSAHISILSYDTPVSSSYLMGTGMTEDLAISTLAGDYGTPAAAYSVRKVRTAYTGALMDVRRSIDNVTSSIGFVSNGDLDTGSLLDWTIPGRSILPGAYSGLAAAYSLRRVSASYSGFAIDVRRDSDNTTSSIGFNGAGNLDTGTLLAFVTGSANTGSGFVAQWYDQSGNNNHATQVSASRQPLIVSSGSLVTSSGKPTVYFNKSVLRSQPFTPVNTPITSFLVNQYKVFPSSGWYVIDQGADEGVLGYISGTSNKNEIYNGTYLTYTENIVTGSNYLWYALFSGSNSELDINNVGTVTGSTGNRQSDQISIGFYGGAEPTSGILEGYISEFLTYHSNVSSSRRLIENNINNYYNIYTGSNHGFVSRWYDQSGNNRHATQTATGSQPVIVLSGSVTTAYGKPTLTYNISGSTNLTFSRLTNIRSLFMVVNKYKVSGSSAFLLGDSTLSSGGTYDFHDPNNNSAYFGGFANTFVRNGNLFRNNIQINTTGSSVLDDTSVLSLITTGNVAASSISQDRDFTERSLDRNISELTIYSTDQNSNRAAVDYGINNYYNIYPQTSSFTTSSFAIYATSGSVSASLNNDLVSGISSTGPLGFITVSRTGSNSLTIARNGVTSSFAVPASGALSTGIFLGAINNNGLALGNSPLNFSFASVGTGLTGAEVRTYTNLTTKLNLDLQRASVLDLYPGARSAYSVRKLSKNYTGSAIQVIRSTDNAVADIGFNGFDLDTTSLLNFVGTGLTNHGYVRTWYDQSGFNNHVTQSSHTTSAYVAIVLSGSLVTQGTKPALYMNGRNMVGSSFTASEFSTYMIGDIVPNTYNGYFYNRTATGFSFTILSVGAGTWSSLLVRYSASIDSSWPQSLQSSGYSIVGTRTGRFMESWNFSGSATTSTYTADGTNRNNTAGGASGWAGGNAYGVGPVSYTGGGGGNMYIQEFIVYNRQQTSAISIQDNLDQYFEVY